MNYQRIYDQIIDRAKKENREYGKGTYYERHHIIPKCMGGEGHVRQWKTHPNIVVLTAREHFICHWLLCRIYTDNKKLAHAFWFMTKQKSDNQQREYRVSSRTYAEAISSLQFTEEHKEKIRKTRVGKKTIVHPQTKEIRYVPVEDLQNWIDKGWENTNYKKGQKIKVSEKGKQKLAEARRKYQTGKTGLQAQAAKGPYTVIFESGLKYTAGSYPELSKLTKISYSTLQNRATHYPGVMKNGFAVGTGSAFTPSREHIPPQKGNTNNSSRVFKGMKSDMTEQGKQKLAEARKRDQTGKTGLQAKAAKGPYTVILESGERHTAGSYPELSKLTKISYSTLQHRMTHKPGVFERGWRIYKGE